ncbi:sigma-70 family RNA polymerase sigma factor [Chitinophaga lutea]
MNQPDASLPESFETLFRLHYPALCRVAFAVVEDEDTAKDIVQDFFLYCLKRKDELTFNVGFSQYAARAVKNAALNYIKRAGRITSFDTPPELPDIPGRHQETDESEITRNAALWAAIASMPQQRQKVFLLSNRDGMKYADIAKQLDISVNTVKTHIKLAYQFLRKECEWMIRTLVVIFFISK